MGRALQSHRTVSQLLFLRWPRDPGDSNYNVWKTPKVGKWLKNKFTEVAGYAVGEDLRLSLPPGDSWSMRTVHVANCPDMTKASVKE